MNDNWGYTDFDTLSMATYGVTKASMDSTYKAYTKGTLGKKCN
jgi:hypothetical protein